MCVHVCVCVCIQVGWGLFTLAAAPHRSEAAVPATTDSNKWVVANSNNLRTATYEHREAKGRGRERGGGGEGDRLRVNSVNITSNEHTLQEYKQ